jgi:hypothetical protein
MIYLSWKWLMQYFHLKSYLGHRNEAKMKFICPDNNAAIVDLPAPAGVGSTQSLGHIYLLF